ncbi:MAG: T9SS type A sorting domain-containing protein [Saprospiraceae bacterium]|nr:T9SS type A sorting domain-containing protein [Saprospiraceae bacterium]
MKRILFSIIAIMTLFAMQNGAAQCTTDAGTMQPGDFTFCSDGFGNFNTVQDGNQVLDANDVHKRIIHDGTATVLGNILGYYSTIGIITKPPTAVSGVTYQVAVIAGNPDGSGGVDLSDPCLSFSGGVTVTYLDPHTVSLPDPVFDCADPSLDLTVSIDPPNGNYFVEWGDGALLPTGTNTITVTNPGWYIAYVTDLNSGCQVWDTAHVVGGPGKPTVWISNAGALGCGEITGKANATGGTQPYTYLWNDGFTTQFHPLTPGTWCVTVTSADNCVASSCYVVPEPVGLDVELELVQGSNCNGTYLLANTTGGAGNLSYFWNPGGVDDANHHDFAEGMNYVTVTDASGCQAVASIFVEDAPVLCGLTYLQLFADFDGNCSFSSGDQLLEGFNMEIQDAAGNITYATTNTLPSNQASWSKYMEPGDYTISIELPNGFWQPCQSVFNITVVGGQTNFFPLGLQVVDNCYDMKVDLSGSELSWCSPNNHFWINYCNMGTQATTGVYVDLQLEEHLSITSAELPFTDLGGDRYQFDLGQVNIGECGMFWVNIAVSCDASMGATPCMEATIFPNDPCPGANMLWSGASLELSATCETDGVHFFVENVGTADMTVPLNFVIIEDAVMFMLGPPASPVLQGEIREFVQPANGATWRMEVEQEPFHPGQSQPALAVEGCEAFGSQGFVNMFYQDDLDGFTDIECITISGPYDPNDKQGFPLGYGDHHQIEPGTPIEYLIRFQNTGNDTAETVVIRDTLSQWLDPLSIVPGAASHPYRFEYFGEGGNIKFVFENINLLDSLLNEPASHGFVSFKVWPRHDVPLGTDIFNTAAIFFDYNPPIFTNTTQHRIDTGFVFVDVWTPLRQGLELNAFPNPMSDRVNIEIKGLAAGQQVELQLLDITGRPVYQKTDTTDRFVVFRNALVPGVYFIRVKSGGLDLGTGKLVVR